MTVTPYKQRLLDTLDDIKQAISDNYKQHLEILFERLERDIINKR